MIYLYGTTHFLQITAPIGTSGSDFITLGMGKLNYARDVADILVQHPAIQLLAEETSPCWPSIAHQMALNGVRRYASIAMPNAERKRRGLPDNQDLIDMTKEENKRAMAEQEAYMAARVNEWLPDIGDILVVCGLYHVRGLKRLFVGKGHEVIADGVLWRDWCRDEYIGGSTGQMRQVCDPDRP